MTTNVKVSADAPDTAIEVMNRATQQMIDVGLCNEFTAIVGMCVGNLVRLMGPDEADRMLAEMVAAVAQFSSQGATLTTKQG